MENYLQFTHFLSRRNSNSSITSNRVKVANPRRAKDFTEADQPYDVWVIDEVSGREIDPALLNMILDGQKVMLDSKYGKVFEKRVNVPIG